MSETVSIAVSPGELIDRITILELKVAHLKEMGARERVQRELDEMIRIRNQQLPVLPEVIRLTEDLRMINRQLWDVEDSLRDCERRGVFGDAFVALARTVYRTNDRRSVMKRKINEAFGSTWHDEKSYAPY